MARISQNVKDTLRLNWLEENDAYALVNDDNGHWACVSDGVQNVPMSEDACDIDTTFFIKKDDWKNSIREAIDYVMEGKDDE